MLNKSTTRIVVVLIAVVLFFLTACGGTEQPITQVQPTRVPSPPTPTLAPTFEVVPTKIRQGEGLTQALLRSCREDSGKECFMAEFAGLGLVWKGSETIYFQSLLAFNSYGVIESHFGYTQADEAVIWGTEGEVARYAAAHGYDTIVSGEIAQLQNGDLVKSVVYSGGRFKYPLSMQIGHYPSTPDWSYFVNGVEYPSVEAAYAAATNP